MWLGFIVFDFRNILKIMKLGLVFGVDVGYLEEEGDFGFFEVVWVFLGFLSLYVYFIDGFRVLFRDAVMVEILFLFFGSF